MADGSAKPSFLVVDDDSFASMVVESLITSLGCHVAVCSSGEECLGAVTEQKFQNSPFSVVLLDWELGDMTGKEVVEKLRAEFPWVSGMKIIMVSGHAPEDETTAALAALGVYEYWEKPVTAKRLQDLLEEHAVAKR